MAKAAKKLQPQRQACDVIALTVATGYARQAVIALSGCEHPHPARARQEFDDLAKAEALLTGALEIVSAHKEQMAVRL